MLLSDALAAEITAATPAVRSAAERLRTIYRSGSAPSALALATRDDALAYAAYRMPATYASARAALATAAPVVTAPGTHLDLGGGTGATVWALADVWPTSETGMPRPDPPSAPTGPPRSTVLDASTAALDTGARLARHGTASVSATRWELARFTPTTTLPRAEFVSASYLLGELDAPTAHRLVEEALRVANLVLVLEPGTPRGFAAVHAAREQVRAAGWHLVAPCPHAFACPVRTPDWCHFSARLPRSSIHRALKDAERGFEDEKFSFVLAAREEPRQSGTTPAGARIMRHPVQRKGLVQFRTCEADGALHDRIVSKRQGPAYRVARDLAWGDPLGPPDEVP